MSLWRGKRVFALDSAKLSFSSSAPALAEADLAAYALVQAKIPAQQLALADGLAGLGFRLVEGEVDLVLALERERAAEPGDGAQTSRLATESDIPVLRAAAAQAFSVSRFRAPWYQPDDSGRFYALWIEKAVLGIVRSSVPVGSEQPGATRRLCQPA